jgi:cytochrome b
LRRILVWDLPTRLFHWLLVGGVLGAFVIAKATDDHGSVFVLHMALGLVVALMVLLRILWGLVGSRYARFASFSLHPKALQEYLRGALTGRSAPELGHNPAASYATVAMLLLPLASPATGLLLSQGAEAAEEAHEVLAFSFLVVAATHVLGADLRLRLREGTADGSGDRVDGRGRRAPARRRGPGGATR